MKRTFSMTLEEIASTDDVQRSEIWIQAGVGVEDSGIGTQSRPFRVNTPDDFDNLFIKRHTAEHGHFPTVYRLMPGVYRTRGCWAHPKFATLWDYDALIGAGDATIHLMDPVCETDGKNRPDIHVISAGSPYNRANRCRVDGIDIHGRSDVHAKTGLYVTSGLRFYGQASLANQVAVAGIRGSYTPVATPSGKIALEAFGISFDSTADAGRVINCFVNAKDNANCYVSAFSAAPGVVDGVVFDDCTAYGEKQYAAFTVYRNTVIRNGRARGFSYGIYNDTGDIENVTVEGGYFNCDRVGIGLVATFPAGSKRSILVDKARFSFPRREAPPVGIELIKKDNTPGVDFWNIHATRCEFASDARFTLVSTDAPAHLLRLVRVSDSIIPLDTRLNVPDGHTMRFTGLISPEGTPYLDTKPTGLVTTFGK